MPTSIINEGGYNPVTTASTATNVPNTGVTIISSTVAKGYTITDPSYPGMVKFLVCDTATASTALRTVTSAGGTFDGVNTILNFTADNQAITLVSQSTARWNIVSNVGTVTASTV